MNSFRCDSMPFHRPMRIIRQIGLNTFTRFRFEDWSQVHIFDVGRQFGQQAR